MSSQEPAMKWRAGTETASGIHVVPEPMRSMEMPSGAPAAAAAPMSIPAMDVSRGGLTCAKTVCKGANRTRTRSMTRARRNKCIVPAEVLGLGRAHQHHFDAIVNARPCRLTLFHAALAVMQSALRLRLRRRWVRRLDARVEQGRDIPRGAHRRKPGGQQVAR